MLTEQTSDSVLWKEVQKNNSKAFALLFKRYWSAAFTSAFVYVTRRLYPIPSTELKTNPNLRPKPSY